MNNPTPLRKPYRKDPKPNAKPRDKRPWRCR